MNFVVTECKPFNSIWVKCYIVNGEREKRGTGKYFRQKDFFLVEIFWKVDLKYVALMRRVRFKTESNNMKPTGELQQTHILRSSI